MHGKQADDLGSSKNTGSQTKFERFHFSTQSFNSGKPCRSKFNGFVLVSAAGEPGDAQTFVGEAIYAVAVRSRFRPSFGRLRNVVRSGRIWLPLFQPELVHGAQERRE